MLREHRRWWSHDLGREMDVVTFGHAGWPMIVFPTSLGSVLEYEDRGMVWALQDKINAGGLRLICVSTVDAESFYANGIHPRARLERYLAYERYLVGDVVNFVKSISGAPTMGVTGCSFGGYHALTMALRHPDVFTSCIPMCGAFDTARFLDGYGDLDSYLLSPPQFLPRLGDEWFLSRFRQNKWVLVTGEADICRGATEEMAAIFSAKHIPHSLHV